MLGCVTYSMIQGVILRKETNYWEEHVRIRGSIRSHTNNMIILYAVFWTKFQSDMSRKSQSNIQSVSIDTSVGVTT